VKIGMVYDADYPWDVRVWKVITCLGDHRHEVHLVCRNLARRPAEETLDGLRIHRLRPFSGARLNELATFPAFINPAWIGRIAQVVRAHGLNVLIVRDLPLALATIAVGRRAGVPVLLDMAENYPAMLRDVNRFERFRLQNLLVRNPRLASLVERIALRFADHVAVVAEEARDRLLRAGVAAGRISIVRNTPRVEVANFPTSWGTAACDPTKLTVAFVGGLEPMRGLDAALKMLAAAVRRVPELRLMIIGDGRWKGDLEAHAQALGIGAHVQLTGRREYQRALFDVQGADIGLIPHRVTSHTNSTIPNKLFEYMLLGKPVLATDMAPVRRLVEEADCGMIYRTPEEGVAALVRLRDETLRRRLGENGRQAVLERYRWDHDGATVVEAVERLADGGSRGRRATEATYFRSNK
jgi:glycosyltransferase involved in cell wall biosynthesis